MDHQRGDDHLRPARLTGEQVPGSGARHHRAVAERRGEHRRGRSSSSSAVISRSTPRALRAGAERSLRADDPPRGRARGQCRDRRSLRRHRDRPRRHRGPLLRDRGSGHIRFGLKAAPLPFQQRPFSIETPAVSPERAPCADDPVTGDDQRDRIRAASRADGARGPGRQAECLCDGTIGHRTAPGDRTKRFPDPPLEWGATQVQRQIVEG